MGVIGKMYGRIKAYSPLWRVGFLFFANDELRFTPCDREFTLWAMLCAVSCERERAFYLD
jgi:hypothetical protein